MTKTISNSKTCSKCSKICSSNYGSASHHCPAQEEREVGLKRLEWNGICCLGSSPLLLDGGHSLDVQYKKPPWPWASKVLGHNPSIRTSQNWVICQFNKLANHPATVGDSLPFRCNSFMNNIVITYLSVIRHANDIHLITYHCFHQTSHYSYQTQNT